MGWAQAFSIMEVAWSSAVVSGMRGLLACGGAKGGVWVGPGGSQRLCRRGGEATGGRAAAAGARVEDRMRAEDVVRL
ncbi:hypothetical protein GCM10010282_29460 [Streptomyces roseolus]|nr:hypothetical protein GCM10010282_29460 [Streptomyces roseolus]